MRIVIDTKAQKIVVPDTFYRQIDEKNAILENAGAGDKKIDYVQFIKDSFEAAIKNPIVTNSDFISHRKRIPSDTELL